MLENLKPTEEEKKVQDKIAFQDRLSRGNAKSSIVKTDKEMETIRFRICEKKEVMPVVMMSTR